MDVGPARQPRSLLVFRVGAEPHFPRLERFPTGKWIGLSSLALFMTRASSLALTCLFSCWAALLQVPVPPPQHSMDSISQGSSTSSFSSVSTTSRQEEPKKDYREVRPPGKGRVKGGLHGPVLWQWLKSQGLTRAAQWTSSPRLRQPHLQRRRQHPGEEPRVSSPCSPFTVCSLCSSLL